MAVRQMAVETWAAVSPDVPLVVPAGSYRAWAAPEAGRMTRGVDNRWVEGGTGTLCIRLAGAAGEVAA